MSKIISENQTPNLKWLLKNAQSLLFHNISTNGLDEIPICELEVYALKDSSLNGDDEKNYTLVLTSSQISSSLTTSWTLYGLTSTTELHNYLDSRDLLIKLIKRNSETERKVHCQYKIDLRSMIMLLLTEEVQYFPSNFFMIEVYDVIITTRQQYERLTPMYVTGSERIYTISSDENANEDDEDGSRRNNDTLTTSSSTGLDEEDKENNNNENQINYSTDEILKKINQLKQKYDKNSEKKKLINEKLLKIQKLKTILEREQKALLTIKAEENIQLNLLKGDQDIPYLCQKVKENDYKTKEIQDEIDEKKDALLKTKFLLEARQIKLLGELQEIFPIERQENGEFNIRGIELPFDLINARDDEQISAALGYVVHLLILASKFLEVPLRYQLLYMSSRSLIRDPLLANSPPSAVANSISHQSPAEMSSYSASTASAAAASISSSSLINSSAMNNAAISTYPLFRKAIERERFEKAIHWLKINIEQLLLSRNLPYDGNKPILYNVQLLIHCEVFVNLSF